LPDARVEAEVAHKLLSGPEASDITDCGDQTDGHRNVDSRDGQQPPYSRIVQRGLCQGSIDYGEVFAMRIDFTQPLLDGTSLIRG